MESIGVDLIKAVEYGAKERNVLDIYRPLPKNPTPPPTIPDWRNISLIDFLTYMTRYRDSRESQVFFNMIKMLSTYIGLPTDTASDPPPPPAKKDPVPVVLFVHGGVWAIGERWQFAQFAARLAQEGVICVVATYSVFPEVLASEMVVETSGVLTWV